MCKSIVLTGGPGSGKTRIAQALAQRHPRRFVTVPESASQVYAALATRWDRLDTAGRREVQRRIYHLQIEQEADLRARFSSLPTANCQPPTIVLDRGTVDGSAYWPDGPADYWRVLGTTLEQELSRYTAVIWLQSAAAIGIYDGDASNPCRHEDAPAAVKCGQRLLAVWQGNLELGGRGSCRAGTSARQEPRPPGHPRLFQVEAQVHFEDKLSAVERIIMTVLGETTCP